MKKLPPCREPSERLNHPGSSVSPLSARGRDKDRILYGLAILLMAASMAGERKLKAAICCDMQQLWSRLHRQSWVNSPGRDKEVSYQPLPDPRLPAEVAAYRSRKRKALLSRQGNASTYC